MFCVDCDEDQPSIRAAILHEEATGHHIEDVDPTRDQYWDLVDYETARVRER